MQQTPLFDPVRRKSVRAFTLVELVVSITILSVIMLSVFMIYSNILQINKRLEAMRMVQEDIRNITEQIASDVRESGIDFGYYDNSASLRTNHYSWSGNSLLATRSGNKYYLMKNSMGGPVICSESDQRDLSIHCYVGREDSSNRRKAISSENVRIRNLRFFLSGNSSRDITNLSEEWKVMIHLGLGIEKKAGVSTQIANNSHVLVQTTISEKVYKEN